MCVLGTELCGQSILRYAILYLKKCLKSLNSSSGFICAVGDQNIKKIKEERKENVGQRKMVMEYLFNSQMEYLFNRL